MATQGNFYPAAVHVAVGTFMQFTAVTAYGGPLGPWYTNAVAASLHVTSIVTIPERVVSATKELPELIYK